jgi:3'-phosphoadenosine 5'-phosphosulfate sulfotransferase (PAPS reductase)/FAD synthetase
MCDVSVRKVRPFGRPVKVRLAAYDRIVVNSSAGKDSQAMLDLVVEMADAEGVRDRVVVVHCDLGRVEWKGTRELAEEQARHYGLRVIVVKRRQGDLLEHVKQRHAKLMADCSEASPWPSSKARYCTSDHKRGQVATVLTKLSKEAAAAKPGRVRILNCLGMRAAESAPRAKLLPFKLDRKQTNGKKVVHTWLPLFDWGVDRVWERIRASGVPSHYAYALGMPRLSCCFCIFAPKAALMLAGRHNPELLDEYVRVEREVGSHFRVGLPIVEIQDALGRGEQPGEIGTWEGM